MHFIASLKDEEKLRELQRKIVGNIIGQNKKMQLENHSPLVNTEIIKFMDGKDIKQKKKLKEGQQEIDPVGDRILDGQIKYTMTLQK